MQQTSKLSYIYAALIGLGSFSVVYAWAPMLYRHVYLTFIALIISIKLIPSFFKSRQFIYILFYSLIVYLNYLWGDQYTIGKEVLDGLTLIMCGCIAYYLATGRDCKCEKSLILVTAFVVAVNTIATYAVYLVQPDVVRLVVEDAEITKDNSYAMSFYRLGVVLYDVPHSIPVLIPPLVMLIRKKTLTSFWRIFSFAFLLSIFILLIISDVMTPLLISIVALLTSLLVDNNSVKRSTYRITIALVLILPFLFSTNVKREIVHFGAQVTSGTLQEKISEIEAGLGKGSTTGDWDARQNFYKQSADAFFDNVLLGTDNVEALGGHSAILDRLASFGLIGIIPWVLSFILFVRYLYRRIPKEGRSYFIICMICFILMLYLKNMSNFFEWMCFGAIVPAMLFFYEDYTPKRRIVVKKES